MAATPTFKVLLVLVLLVACTLPTAAGLHYIEFDDNWCHRPNGYQIQILSDAFNQCEPNMQIVGYDRDPNHSFFQFSNATACRAGIVVGMEAYTSHDCSGHPRRRITHQVVGECYSVEDDDDARSYMIVCHADAH
ncbi:uncharacterized protein MONBRDRAFT_12021 [Monosiga brevicollis MX1]|uniref:Uncharacterized protein n=1 Tax=Monosiga brevicollis TaxID=81824 RepID=A9VAZ8_MONBE|nr:uncharacterized protein MONBRDRAFT_12021 [Monosiga brevicollis MX1]EDQ85304.1 predicted protein [Monosiga brevicollis MX1]|eukprot:XP_001749925.1 hypothetical protein [Monosiga brevicollis MX1]